MNDGNFTIYTIQYQIVGHKTSRGKWIDGSCDKWRSGVHNPFKKYLDPWVGAGNQYGPQFKESYKEMHSVAMSCDLSGWHSIKWAIAAYNRLRAFQNSEDGQKGFPSYDGYNKIESYWFYNFRLAKIEVSKKTTPLTLDDVLALT